MIIYRRRSTPQDWPAVPAGQSGKGIPADNQEQGCFAAEFGAQRLQGFHRVGRAFPTQFAVIHQQLLIRLGGQTDHLQPLLRRRARAVPVRRLGIGDQPQLIQRQVFTNLDGATQVSEVNRIKGTAQNADAQCH